MSTPDETQDAPVMDGATEATEEEKTEGRQQQIDADNTLLRERTDDDTDPDPDPDPEGPPVENPSG